MAQAAYHVTDRRLVAIVVPCHGLIVAGHSCAMRQGIFQGKVRGGPIVFENEVFAEDVRNRRLQLTTCPGRDGFL